MATDADHRGEPVRAWADYVAELRGGSNDPFETQWERFRRIFGERGERDRPPTVWQPSAEQFERSNVGRLMRELELSDFEQLHAWSVRDRIGFWRKTVERLGVVFRVRPAGLADLSGGTKHVRWLPGAAMNAVDSCFTADADSPAVIGGREGTDQLETTTYGELARMVDKVAGSLEESGFRKGQGIALYMPMTLECVAAYLGIVRAGCRVISIADSFPAVELRRRLAIGEAAAIITVDHYHRAGKTIELYEKVKQAQGPQAIVILEGDAQGMEFRPGDLLWEDVLGSKGAGESLACDPDDVTNVLFSSGTTGEPKAIPWSHLTPLKCAMDGHFHHDIQPGDVVAWPTNIGWMMGPWLIYASLINRATIALYEGAPTGRAFADFVDAARITMLGLVPSLVRAWRTSGDFETVAWRHLRVFSSTGEPSNCEDYLWLMSRAGYRAPVIEYCGGTEIGGGYLTGTVIQPASPATFTTPTLGLDVAILDESGREVGEGEAGELFLLPPSIGLSQSLLNADHDEVYYAGVPAGPNGELLRRHGDRILRLPGGFYRAQGRADDTMNLGGIKVSALELERVIDSHPAVYESAAVAVQPTGGGADLLVVFVVPRDEVEREVLAAELGKRISSGLNPLFKIADLVVTDRLPRTASNKLMRRELRARYTKSQA